MDSNFKGGLVPLFLVTLFLFVAVLAGFSGLSLPIGNEVALTGQVVTSFPSVNTIQPGAGWTGLSQIPAGSGNGPTPIVRWDVVPYQTISSKLGIGVVAFHINGINRVEFSVENGPWVSVNQMTRNPDTGITEYWVYIDPTSFPQDGLKEVRARVVPNVGQAIVLQGNNLTDSSNGIHSLFINTNGRGTLPSPVRWVDSVSGNDSTGDGSQSNPFKTILAAAKDVTIDHRSSDGAIIYLKAGDYFWGSAGGSDVITNNRWVTITAAPGLDRGQVKITDSSTAGLRTRLVHLKNVHVKNTKIKSTGAENAIWVDNVLFTGSDLRSIEFPVASNDWSLGIYANDSTYDTMLRAVGGYALGRNLLVRNIGGDMFKNPKALFNVVGENLIDADPNRSASQGDVHRDVLQYQTEPNNVVVYGLTATKNIDGQDFFWTCGAGGAGCRGKNVAVVGYVVDAGGNIPGKYGISTDHLLIWNMTHTKILLFPGDSGEPVKEITNLDIRNSVFGSLGGLNPQSWRINNGGNYATNNHFISGNTHGINYTSGGSLSEIFTKYTEWNSPDNDLRPKANSVVVGANRPYPVQRLVPVDASGSLIPVGSAAAIGGLQSSSASLPQEPEPEPDPEQEIVPPSSEPSSGVHRLGARVQVTEKLRVRRTPGGNIFGGQRFGILGTIVDGPVTTGGYTWWKVDYDQGADGWSAQDFLLLLVSGVPATPQGPVPPPLPQIPTPTIPLPEDRKETGTTPPNPNDPTVSVPAPATTPPSAPAPTGYAPSAGLVVHFPFDGSIVDSARGLRGTAEGAVSYESGKVGQAVVLNGASAISLGNKTLADLGVGNQFTVAAWVKTSNPSKTLQAVFAKGDMRTDGAVSASFDLALAYGRPRVRVSDGTSVMNQRGEAVSAGAWQHIAGTFDGSGNIRIFRDGALARDFSNPSITSINDSTVVLSTGIGYSSGIDKRYFEGSIDDLRIYNRALSDAEIKALYGSVLGADDNRDSYLGAVVKGINSFFGWIASLFGF